MKETSPLRRRKLLSTGAITVFLGSVFVFSQMLSGLAPERPEGFLRKVTGQTDIELCDIGSMGFTAVNDQRSPIQMRLFTDRPVRAGQTARVRIGLATAKGRPIRMEELQEVHTEKIHLLIVDPGLGDYHHKHPVSTGTAGEFVFAFTPAHPGTYRVFADIVPLATGRPAYGAANIEVLGEGDAPEPARPSETFAAGDHRLSVTPPADGLRVRRPALITLSLAHAREGEPVEMQPVMGAFAHLVAFDRHRSGFAHMHPVEEGLDIVLDPIRPELRFMFYAEEPGFYKVWAQVKIDGEEIYAPFGVEVL